MRVKMTYRWKVISDDGLLKEPEGAGPSYNREELNPACGGFDTEDDAHEAFRGFNSRKEWNRQTMVLITEYRATTEED